MRQTIYKIALAGCVIAGAETLSVAAPAPSLTAAVKSAAVPSTTAVGCELTGWDWSGGGIRGAMWPGILAVGGYYNSISYGYSGVRPYYGTRHPYAYSCVYTYPVQYVPMHHAHKRHRHHVTGFHVQ